MFARPSYVHTGHTAFVFCIKHQTIIVRGAFRNHSKLV